MIYVISKETYGEYEVRDIQCNANWDCCPYSEYALIPENLLGGILATQGYCDIVLNDAGNEVVSFTAREIPSVPDECWGTSTVSRKLVWENPDITGEQFVSQSIDIVAAGGWDGVEVVYFDGIAGENDALYNTGYLPIVEGVQYRLTANGFGTATGIYHRTARYFRGNTDHADVLFFDNAYYRSPDAMGVGEIDNFRIIPYQIYAIKGVTSREVQSW